MTHPPWHNFNPRMRYALLVQNSADHTVIWTIPPYCSWRYIKVYKWIFELAKRVAVPCTQPWTDKRVGELIIPLDPYMPSSLESLCNFEWCSIIDGVSLWILSQVSPGCVDNDTSLYDSPLSIVYFPVIPFFVARAWKCRSLPHALPHAVIPSEKHSSMSLPRASNYTRPGIAC